MNDATGKIASVVMGRMASAATDAADGTFASVGEMRGRTVGLVVVVVVAGWYRSQFD